MLLWYGLKEKYPLSTSNCQGKREFPHVSGMFKCAGLIVHQDLPAIELVTFLNSHEAPLKKLVKSTM